MLRADDDQRIRLLRFERQPHAIVGCIERVAHDGIGALLAAGDAGRVAAYACEHEAHDRPSARE